MHNLQPKIQRKLVIKGSEIKVSLGHPSKVCGVGIHKDKRLRRQRTRGAIARAAMED